MLVLPHGRGRTQANKQRRCESFRREIVRRRVRHSAGHELKQHNAERIQIGSRIDFATIAEEIVKLFGRNIGQGAARRRTDRLFVAAMFGSEIEIEQKRRTIVRDQHIRRLQIAVEHSESVCVSQPFG